jgi:hypothetical protein
MSPHPRPAFRHRHNRDGVIDSICCECLLTVASASVELGLTGHEEAHVCDPVRVYQLSADPSRRISSDPSPQREYRTLGKFAPD